MTSDSVMMNIKLSQKTKKYIGGLFIDGKTKITFAKGTPKLFLTVNGIDKQSLDIWEGSGIVNENEMIVGYEEAMMMKKENLIQKPGDELTNFFGIAKMKVVGILAPTGTILDKYHLINSKTAQILNSEGNLRTVVEDDGGVELFYIISTRIPELLKENMSLDDFKSRNSNNIKYAPMYFGSEQARMMIKNGEFKKQGDTLKEEGTDVIVAGILPKTNTSFDEMHFVGEDFRLE